MFSSRIVPNPSSRHPAHTIREEKCFDPQPMIPIKHQSNKGKARLILTGCIHAQCIWAPSSEFVSSSIPSWQILTAHAQPFRGARDLAFCLKVPLDSLLVWASSGGSGETARMRRLAWTFAARIGDKYQIRLTRSIYCLLAPVTQWSSCNAVLVNGSIKNHFQYEPLHDKTNNMACAPIEDSHQPEHPPSLIRDFAVCIKTAWVLSYPLSAQRRLWSDWVDAGRTVILLVLSWVGSYTSLQFFLAKYINKISKTSFVKKLRTLLFFFIYLFIFYYFFFTIIFINIQRTHEGIKNCVYGWSEGVLGAWPTQQRKLYKKHKIDENTWPPRNRFQTHDHQPWRLYIFDPPK